METEKDVRLERKLSPLNVWALALGCIIGWGAFVMPGNTFLVKAGPLGTAIAMAISALIMIIIAFNYNYMVNRFPIAGGEFIYTRNAFGEKHAFICSWFLGLSFLAIVPLNATALALIGRNLMNNIFQVGFHYSIAGYDIYLGEILLAESALVLFAVMSMKDVKIAGWFQTALVFALVGGVLVISIAALFRGRLSAAFLSPGFNPDNTAVAGILAVIAVSPWAFVGFGTIPQSAEEFRFSARKTQLIMILSILFGASVYVVLNTVTAAVVPEGYSTWVEYIRKLPELNGLLSLPTFHAGYQLLGAAGVIFLCIAVVGAILSGIIGFYMATSRLLYSLAKDSVLPAWFGQLHPKYRTPVHAILFTMCISMIAPFFGRTALGWIVDMSSIGAAIGYGYTSLSAFKFAREEGNRGIMASGILGSLLALFFCVILIIPIPVFRCSLCRESYICLIVWIFLGALFFLRSGKHR
ncbi:MAG: APC family permease [Spirochaetales bacterium]|nr:APC family permease [Spirochaetales bacterium]